MNPNTHLLPCCTWFAPAYHGFTIIGSPEEPTYTPAGYQSRQSQYKPQPLSLFILRRMHGYEWIPAEAIKHSDYIVSTTAQDHEWLRLINPKITQSPRYLFCHDPESLIRLYARATHIRSLRLHASIPALALGCSVINYHK